MPHLGRTKKMSHKVHHAKLGHIKAPKEYIAHPKHIHKPLNLMHPQ